MISAARVRGVVDYMSFGCRPSGIAANAHRVRPDVVIERESTSATSSRRMAKIRMWGCRPRKGAHLSVARYSRASGRGAPHQAKKAAHYHHQGINPTTFNDGVGHVRRRGRIPYQWRPSKRDEFLSLPCQSRAPCRDGHVRTAA